MTRQRADDPRNAAVVRAAARAADPDRYLAALLAPARARGDLIALAAFLGEVARIPDAVHEPMMGEIRLQWWRDALETLRAGGKTGNPVADALGPVIARHALPEELLVSVIEGRRRDLEPGRHDLAERMPELAAYIAETDGAAFRLSARVLGVEASPAVSDLLAASAGAYGRARIVRAAVRAGETRQQGFAPRRTSLAQGSPSARHHRAKGRYPGDSAGRPCGALFGGFGKAGRRPFQTDSGHLPADAGLAALAGQRAGACLIPAKRRFIMVGAAGRLLALCALACALTSSAAGQGQSLPVPHISWSVENAFRFFTDAADTEVHRATYFALSPRTA